jgi:hypothetical protein
MAQDEKRTKASRADLWWVGAPLLGALVCLVLFDLLGRRALSGWTLDLGSFRLPEAREAMLWLAAAVFGLPAAAFLAIAAARATKVWPEAKSALELFPKSEDKVWIAFGALAALIVPIAIRMLLLDEAPVADDESAYQFGAQLVASGHLTAASPPMKLFYDRSFMINDGHLYPMYFMGWPILMAPGVWLGIAGFMNAIYSAATVPAIYLAGRELGGRTVARAALLLFVTAPMFAIAAATQMSNTTCLMALAWTFACWLRSRRNDAKIGWHVGVGVAFGFAALIRPSSALGVGGPIVAAWLYDTLRGPRGDVARRLLAFGVPAALAFALFLFINRVQNGSPTVSGYAREFAYANENGLRFTHWGLPHYREQIADGTLRPHFSGRPPIDSVANIAAALLRLATATFGWVPALLFVPFGVRRHRAGGLVLVAAMVLHCLVHFNVRDLGIDTFGTHHYFEIALPMVLLTAVAVRVITRSLARRLRSEQGRATPYALLPAGFLAGLTVFAVTSTTPPRFRALYAMSGDVNLARDMLARENVKRAVVFSPQPFTSRMSLCSEGPRHFVHWRPNNDPELKNDILWVNHVTIEEDRKLMAQFPDRRGIVFLFDGNCTPVLVPLDSQEANRIPRGNIDNLDPPPGVRLANRVK